MNTVLFDLDGTLLPMDVDIFTKHYLKELSSYFSDIMDSKQLINYIWTSTEEMVANIEEVTNEDVFMNKFQNLINDDIKVYRDRFDEFYNTNFLKLKGCTVEMPYVKKSVDLLKKKGYEMVIATNPLFPLTAILHRINWAGLDPSDFIYITSYERNHYCKPQIQFYQEVLKDINKKPSECIMVGNDVQEDLVSKELGIKTFLIEDYIIHRKNEPINTDYQGSYEDFYKFTQSLPSLK